MNPIRFRLFVSHLNQDSTRILNISVLEPVIVDFVQTAVIYFSEFTKFFISTHMLIYNKIFNVINYFQCTFSSHVPMCSIATMQFILARTRMVAIWKVWFIWWIIMNNDENMHLLVCAFRVHYPSNGCTDCGYNRI